MFQQSRIVAAIVVVVAIGAAVAVALNRPGTPSTAPTPAAPQAQVKEFTMTSYYSPEAKRPYFSLGEMVVNQGDRVRIKVTNTMGMHDFVIDEYGVNRETPLNQEQVIEFTADKAGEFVYYCSKPGHRAMGQWGTLKVIEQ